MSNPYTFLIKAVWQFVGKDRTKFIIVYAMFVITEGILSLYPILLGMLFDEIQKNPSSTIRFTWLYAGAFLILKLLEFAIRIPARMMENRISFNISNNFLFKIYHHVLYLPISWHKAKHSSETVGRIRKAHSALKSFSENGYLYIASIVRFVTSSIAMVYYSSVFGIIAILLSFVAIWVILRYNKPFLKFLNKVNEIQIVISKCLSDSLTNMMTVMTLKLQGIMRKSLFYQVSRIWEPMSKNLLINEIRWFIVFTIMSLIYLLIILGYVNEHWVPTQTFLIGGLVTLLGFVNQFTNTFYEIAGQYVQLVQYQADYAQINVIDEKYALAKIQDKQDDYQPCEWNIINIRNINFTYSFNTDREKQHGIFNISLDIINKQRVAIIGKSGSGKSTLLTILQGLYNSDSKPSVIVDNVIKDMTFVNRNVILFPQEPEIFDDSILYNLTFGQSIDEKKIKEACDAAELSDFLKTLPDGIQTRINQRGGNISVGQKQRITLARGILAIGVSSIILLDEPTSNIDSETEIKIYKNLFQICSDKTIFSVMHNLSFIQYFNYIYILGDNCILDHGTFDHLQQHSQIFNKALLR